MPHCTECGTLKTRVNRNKLCTECANRGGMTEDSAEPTLDEINNAIAGQQNAGFWDNMNQLLDRKFTTFEQKVDTKFTTFEQTLKTNILSEVKQITDPIQQEVTVLKAENKKLKSEVTLLKAQNKTQDTRLEKIESVVVSVQIDSQYDFEHFPTHLSTN